ncbi:RluA family pseudouridine synthase [Lentilactobacillus sp. Marseille-Q4993]|uniref:RluA family pseudouridine synthase n=1 Tax=Lentilactobacillus sp. Marseille-Q4993 TaxID=3039492 RepID=UPI0024BC8463|nr:RluA family pseudouridine synthase [Lentilactobacillus sp. Marseille-Q4993]
MQFEFTRNENDPENLKAFLNSRGISHRMYRGLKDAGNRIFVDGNQADPAAKLNEGAVVGVSFPDEQSDPNVAVSDQPISVVYEDSNWLIFDKPAGLTVVPGPANREDTLVNRIKGHWQRNGEVNLVPHIITRLDRFTSGLVLVAKHRFANSLANELSDKKLIHKEYFAIVSGNGLDKHAHIDKPIAKDPDGFGQMISDGGKSADTEYWVEEQTDMWTTVRVILHTGRTHQIRVHFAAIGHPVLGDELYSGPLDLGINRQALHAKELAFDDPFTNEKRSFVAPIPEDMKAIID